MNQIFRLFDLRLRSGLFVLLAAGALLAASPANAQPVFSKAFAPDSIGPGSTTRLTFVIDNGSEAAPASNLAFTDALPAGVTIAQSPSVSETCLGTVSAPGGGSTITYSGGSVGAGGSCEIAVDVTSSSVGTHTNVSGDLTSSAGNSGTATADLTVDEDRPGFSKSFSADPIQLGETITLTFTLDHTAGGSNRFNLIFSDTLPAGLVVAGPSNTDGTCPQVGAGAVTAVPGSSTISYFGSGPLAPGATCTISVDVTADEPGPQVNRSGELTSTPGGLTESSGFASDSVEVTVDPLTLVKSFVNDPAAPGQTVTLRFTVHNFTRDPASAITFSDDIDAALSGLVATGLPQNDVCGAGSQVSGTGVVTLTGGNLPGGGSCSFDVTLDVPASAAAGVYTNTTSDITGSSGGEPVTGSPAADDLVIAPAPILSKTITPDPAQGGDTLTVEFQLENPSNDEMTDIAFSDVFTDFIPGSTITPPADGYCFGAGSSTTSPTTIQFSGIDLFAQAGCTFSFDLQVPAGAGQGLYTNTTSEVTGQDAGAGPVTGRPASDDVVIVAAPTLTKAFINDPVAAGDTVTLRFTLNTPEGAAATATDIAFTDDLSAVLAGLSAIDTPINDVCGAGSQISGTSVLTFTGGSLAPGSSCSFEVTLQVPAGAPSGAFPNTTSDVTATVEGLALSGPPASDDLDIANLQGAKEFIDDPAVAGGTVTLEFMFSNDDPVLAASDIGFSDDLGAVLAGLAYNGGPLVDMCGAGSQLSGTSILTMTGGNLAPGATCSFAVELDVPAGTSAGEYFNVSSPITANIDGGPVGIAPMADSLVVIDPLTIEKEFTDDPVAAGGAVTLDFTLSNAHPTEDATGVAFTDDLDAALSGLEATSTPVSACGGTLSGISLLTFGGGTVPAGDSCTISVTLLVPASVPTGTTATNITSPVSGTIDGVGVTGSPASDELQVELAGFSKAFDGPTTATGTAVLTFVIENFSDDPMTDLAFNDDLSATLAGLTAVGLPINDVCGAGSSISGTSSLTFSGGSLEAGESCSFDVTVQVPAGAAPGSYTNTTSDLSASGFVLAPGATDDLFIEPPPAFSKSFSPAAVGEGLPSTLAFTIDNTASAVAAADLDFTDNLPAGVVVAVPPNASTTCSGGTITAPEGSGTVSYAGGSVAAGATCTVSVDVLADTMGSYVNTSGELTSSSGPSGTANATLTVLAAPTVAKGFSPDTIAIGATSTVTVTIDNTANPIDATNVTFTDGLPAGVEVAPTPNASTTCTGGTLTAVAGAGSFDYSGGTVSAGASCTVEVDVTAPDAGTFENTVTVESSLGTSAPASSTLEVSGAPLVDKVFSPDEIAIDGSTTVTITIDNTASTLPATDLAFTDTLEGGLVVADPANASSTCTGGTLTAVPGSGEFSYSAGTVAAEASCTVQVDVTAPEAGAIDNTVTLSSSLGTSPAASDTLNVAASPLVDKAFSPAEIAFGESTTVTVTIDNTANALSATGLAFTDTLQVGLVVADPANASTTCTGGTLTAAPGASEFSYSGGSVAGGASCAVMVDVTSTSFGPVENLVVLDSSLGESDAASAVVQVNAPIFNIPVDNVWALLIMAMLLALAAVWRLRRVRTS